MKSKIAVFRKEHFNAAHRLHNSAWSDEENKKVFGKCNNQNFHGHNYELVIKVIGYPDEETGYVIDMKILSDIIKKEVLHKFDHRNLNLDTEEFKNLNPTAENIAMVIWNILRKEINTEPENIAMVIWNILRKEINTELELFVTLHETDNNYVQYPA